MTHSSNHPCTWCNAKKDKLEDIGHARTFGGIRRMNDKRRLLAPSLHKDHAKNYENVLFTPVIGAGSGCRDLYSYDERVVEVICPGELHILLGVTNLIVDLIEEELSEEGTEEWCTELSIQKRPYRGGTFPGEDCKLIMSKGSVTKLKEVTGRRDKGLLPRIQLLADTLLALDAVSKKCFSNILADDWESDSVRSDFSNSAGATGEEVMWRHAESQIACGISDDREDYVLEGTETEQAGRAGPSPGGRGLTPLCSLCQRPVR